MAGVSSGFRGSPSGDGGKRFDNGLMLIFLFLSVFLGCFRSGCPRLPDKVLDGHDHGGRVGMTSMHL